MKAVILAGGFGTRLAEETSVTPKPMVEIGGRPILWHILKIFSAHGVNDFVICCGYKSYVIKEFFSNYFLHTSDMTFDIANRSVEIHQNNSEPWKVTCVDTGDETMTGGRLKRVRQHLGDETFLMTYGDGVADIDVRALIDFHEREKRLATVTAVLPPGRWGVLEIAEGRVQRFREKAVSDVDWINAGFFVLSPKVIDYVESDAMTWEKEPLERLAREGQLSAYKHRGFWQAMDTMRDKHVLENLWSAGKAPWKVWP